MNRHQSLRATIRAHWFAELSSALDEGERILGELIAEGFGPVETERLRLRLIELRAEIGRINRVGLTKSRVIGAKWPEGAAMPIERSSPLHPDWLPRRD
jgi:hypothetical protein